MKNARSRFFGGCCWRGADRSFLPVTVQAPSVLERGYKADFMSNSDERVRVKRAGWPRWARPRIAAASLISGGTYAGTEQGHITP